jgi:hypothetical protein
MDHQQSATLDHKQLGIKNQIKVDHQQLFDHNYILKQNGPSATFGLLINTKTK